MVMARKRYANQRTALATIGRFAARYIAGRFRGAGLDRSINHKVLNHSTKVKKGKGSKTVRVRLHQSARRNAAGTGGSFSNFWYTRRRMTASERMTERLNSKNYLITNGYGRITNTVGIQTKTMICYCWDNSDIASIESHITGNPTQRMLLQRASLECMFTNQDYGNCKMEIYDIIYRRDVGNANNPVSAWINGNTDENGDKSSIVGCRPFSSALFCQYYKVCKITHVLMPAGHTHVHRTKFAVNKSINYEVVAQEGTTLGYGIKGLAFAVMVVLYGAPYNDTTTKTQVSTGECAVDFIWKKQLSYTWNNDSTTNIFATNVLPAAFSVNESILNAASGVITLDTAEA